MQQPGCEGRFKKIARGCRVVLAYLDRGAAGGCPVGSIFQGIAGQQEGRKGFGKIVAGPLG
jgi:hypothetical protein